LSLLNLSNTTTTKNKEKGKLRLPFAIAISGTHRVYIHESVSSDLSIKSLSYKPPPRFPRFPHLEPYPVTDPPVTLTEHLSAYNTCWKPTISP